MIAALMWMYYGGLAVVEATGVEHVAVPRWLIGVAILAVSWLVSRVLWIFLMNDVY